MSTSKVEYAYFCICGRSSITHMEVCEWCGSHEIDRAPYVTRIYDDVAEDARMEEIRANTDPLTGCAYAKPVKEEEMAVPNLRIRQAG